MELMKSGSMTIFILFLLYSNILCEQNISEIIEKSYSLLKDLSVYSTIYFSRNIKCISYSSTQSFCLINNSLYRTVENQYYFLMNVSDYDSDYDESFYYDISVYNSGGYLDALLFHFTDDNHIKLKFCYITNGEINQVMQYIYYNESLNPYNKYINCQYISGIWNAKCYYINKEKEIVEIEMSSGYYNGNNEVKCLFKTAKINDDSILNENTFIMTSKINNKFKYFSCSHFIPQNSLDIYIEKEGTFQFSSNGQVSINDLKKLNFYCNNEEKLFLFGLFKEEQSSGDSGSSNLDISSFIVPYQAQNNETGPIIKEYNNLIL